MPWSLYPGGAYPRSETGLRRRGLEVREAPREAPRSVLDWSLTLSWPAREAVGRCVPFGRLMLAMLIESPERWGLSWPEPLQPPRRASAGGLHAGRLEEEAADCAYQDAARTLCLLCK